MELGALAKAVARTRAAMRSAVDRGGVLEALADACDGEVCDAVAVYAMDRGEPTLVRGRGLGSAIGPDEGASGAVPHLVRSHFEDGTWARVDEVPLGDLEDPWGLVVLCWTRPGPDGEQLALSSGLIAVALERGPRAATTKYPGPEAENGPELRALGRMARVQILEARNVLAGVDGALQLVGRTLDSDPDTEELLRVARARLHALCEWLMVPMEFARPLELIRERTDLGEVLRRAAAQASREVRDGPSMEPVDAPKALANVDPVLLHLALEPVFRNAIAASGRTGHVRSGADPVDDGWVVWVQDDGPGFPPELFPLAGSPFVTTRPSAWGLGLAWAARVVGLHGGSLRISLVPEGGTRVELYLPDRG